MTKLLCSGDWHLGAGSEYGRQPGDRLRDQRDVALKIADLALLENVDGILLAGDLLEGPAMLPEHLEVITAFLERLDGQIPVLAVTGNGKHDLAMRDTSGLAIFNHVDGIRVSSKPTVIEFAGCSVATLPWVSPARLVASRNGGDRDEVNADVSDLVIEIAHKLISLAMIDRPSILLAHWSVSGASLPNGLPTDQLREPVIPLPDLEAIGYDAIVLGHIHKPQDLGSGDRPIFYVGSPLPLNFGEAGTVHGATILQFHEDGWSTTFTPIKSRPFVTHDLDLTTHEGIFDLASLDPIPDGAIVRVRYRATAEQARSFDVAAWRREILETAAAVKIQPEIVREQRARVAGLDEQATELDALEQWITAAEIDAPLVDGMRSRTRDYIGTAA